MNMRTLLDKLLGSADWGIHPDDHKRPGADAPVRVHLLDMPVVLFRTPDADNDDVEAMAMSTSVRVFSRSFMVRGSPPTS